MTNLNGWALTGKLLGQHFGELGNLVAQRIASEYPDIATQVDRDQEQEVLLKAAEKQAVAQRQYKEKAKIANDLQVVVDTDSKAAALLVDHFEAGKTTEERLTKFANNLESNKKLLETTRALEAQAKKHLEEIQQIVTIVSNRLAAFDAQAAQAKRDNESAKAQIELQTLHQQNQAELSGLTGKPGQSRGLDALAANTQKLNDKAEAMRIVTGINQAPLDEAAEIEAIRASVRDAAPAESAADRLRRIAGVGNDKTTA